MSDLHKYFKLIYYKPIKIEKIGRYKCDNQNKFLNNLNGFIKYLIT